LGVALFPIAAPAVAVVAGTTAGTGAAFYGMIFPATNDCYEMQKIISPVAIKPPSFSFGSNQTGIGFDASFGFPTIVPGGRLQFGTTYHFNSYGGYKGWETRTGWEVQILPNISYSSTRFKGNGFDQTTGKLTLGRPMAQISYENDYMFFLPGADGGDRWRTAALGINAGPFSVNLNMFTGDPGLDPNNRRTYFDKNGRETYGIGANGEDPDKYRVGVLSIGLGPFRIGRNSESIRNTFQNKFAHDFLMRGKSPYFLRMGNVNPSWYWYFGTGSGNTTW
jgi:hypothetical protein